MLLANDGKTQQQISDFIGCSLRTVNYWFTHSDPDNLDSFRDGRGTGNHQKITAEVQGSTPPDCGTGPGENWDMNLVDGRLKDYLNTLAKETTIVLSSRQVNRILKKRDIVIFGRNTL